LPRPRLRSGALSYCALQTAVQLNIMKTAVLFTFITGPLCCLAVPAHAALNQRTNVYPALPLTPPSLSLDQARVAALPWQAKSRNAYQTEWTRVERRTNAVTRRVVEIPHAFVEVGAGLNRKDASGRWVPADASFEITDRGAEARWAAHRVLLAPDIASPGAVQVEKDGVTLHCHPLCVGYYDPVDGRSVALAEITNAVGWIVASNVVVYSNCFDGLRASIRYHNSRAGLESDLLLHEQPLPPTAFGLSLRCRLELFTELVGDTPTPRLQQRVLQQEVDAVLRRQMVEPDFADSTLDFGALSMGPGRAFLTGTNSQRRAAGAPLQVGKRYEVIGGRRVLIEAVEWSRMQRLLTNLPAASVSGVITNAALHPGRAGPLGQPSETLLAQNGALSGRDQGRDRSPVAAANSQAQRIGSIAAPSLLRLAAAGDRPRSAGGAALRSLPAPRTILPTGTRMQMLAARSASHAALDAEPPTFVLDWEAKGNESASGFNFEAGATYWITGPFTLSGTTTFEEGTCLKFDTSGSLQIQGPVRFQGSAYRAITLTGKDDDRYGEVLPGSTGAPWNSRYGTPMLYLSPSAPAADLSHFRMCFANQGIWIENSSPDNLVRHAQIVHSWTPVYLDYAGLRARNVLAHDVDQLFLGGWPALHGEHLTVHTAFSVADGYTPLYLTNSLVVNTDDTAAWYITDHCEWRTEQDAVFQTVGAGSHYLPEPSVFRDAGTAAIDPTLATELRQLTTYPPTLLAGTCTEDLTLGPTAIADADGSPDLGYHYPLAHYAANLLRVENVTLTLTEGTALATYGISGVWLDGGHLRSEGTWQNPNHIFPYTAVQEQAMDWGAPASPNYIVLNTYTYGPTPPTIRLTCTKLERPRADAHHLYSVDQWCASRIELRDCEVRGGQIYSDIREPWECEWALTNNLFLRVTACLQMAPAVSAFNNTYKSCLLSFWKWGAPPWVFKDNLFDACLIDQWIIGDPPYDTITHSHNGYVNPTNRLAPEGLSDQVLSSLPYESGPFGRYYLPPLIGGQPNPLIDHGSRSAAAAALVHFTTQIAEGAKEATEGTGQVDIGLHYVASAQGLALDTDHDGIADYSEDPNGNGESDAGETCFTDADTDYDGRNDGDELLLDFTNPLDSQEALPAQLASWRFDDAGLLGEEGQTPLESTRLMALDASWSGTAVRMDSSPVNGRLSYRDVEGNGHANVNCRHGTVMFWYKPLVSLLPLTQRLIEMGNADNPADGLWALSLNGQAGDQSVTFQTDVMLINAPVAWSDGTWHQVVLTYSAAESKLYVDGTLAGSGLGVASIPTKAARSLYGLSIGANHAGADRADGSFDELQTFNYVLSLEEISGDFQNAMLLDSDSDGLADVREAEAGTDPASPDTDGDALSDRDELEVRYTNPLDADSDYDGCLDNEDTAPWDPLVFTSRQLAYWRFDSDNLIGEAHEAARAAQGLQLLPSWSGYAVTVENPSGGALLTYGDEERGVKANINCRHGTVRFWFRPSWTSGSDLLAEGRLIEVGSLQAATGEWWALSFNRTRTALLFETEANGTRATYFTQPIAWNAGEWHQIVLTYDAGSSRLYLDGEPAQYGTGTGIQSFPSSAARAQGFAVGANHLGLEQAKGAFDELETYNYPLTAVTIQAAYAAISGESADDVVFYLPGEAVNSQSVTLVVSGPPGGTMSILDGAAIPGSGTWVPLVTTVIDFGPGEGTRFIWVGVRDAGNPPGEKWTKLSITVDTTPPAISITSPTSTALQQPVLQLKGSANEAVSRVTYDVANALGTELDREGYLLPGQFNLQTTDFALRNFQCFDIPMAPGQNTVTLHVTDLAGNTTPYEAIYTFNPTSDSTPPHLTLTWPENGAKVSGNSFTLRGLVDDPTARITLAGAGFSPIEAFVDRDGHFQAVDVPLQEGVNHYTNLAWDAASNVSAPVSFAVQKSVIELTVVDTSFAVDQASRIETASLSGTVEPGYQVYVNGLPANTLAGAWSMSGVPAAPGTAPAVVVEARSGGGLVEAAISRCLDVPPHVFLAFKKVEEWDALPIHCHCPESCYVENWWANRWTWITQSPDSLYESGGFQETEWFFDPGPCIGYHYSRHREYSKYNRRTSYTFSENACPYRVSEEAALNDSAVYLDLSAAESARLPETLYPYGHREWGCKERYRRTATSGLTLFTGSPQDASGENLLVIEASAQRWDYIAEDPGLWGTQIPAESIWIRGRRLIESEENPFLGYYVASFPPNALVDVTARIPSAAWFTAALAPQLPPKARLLTDVNRDGMIDSNDPNRTFYFWINDDDDDDGDLDIPGWKKPNALNSKVDGIRDLNDFFPVFVDLKSFLDRVGLKSIEVSLRHLDEAVNFFETDLTPENAGSHLRSVTTAEKLKGATVTRATLLGTKLSPDFLRKIQQGKGIVLVEGCKKSDRPLELVVRDKRLQELFSVRLELSLDGVEQMFRHRNLRAAGGDATGGAADRLLVPANYPDALTIDRWFVFLHGYNVNGQQARGVHSETFKRMFWSRSNARFVAVSWRGDEDQWTFPKTKYTPEASLTRDFHANVVHAFETAEPLAAFLEDFLPEDVLIAAHSLGVMVASATIEDFAYPASQLFAIDGAVAIEAYDANAPRSPDMVHVEWGDNEADPTTYPHRLRASEWHRLFPPHDGRSLLTWRGRFASVSPRVFNFYSNGEEVLAAHPYALKPHWTQLRPAPGRVLGTWAWALQEKLKGRECDIVGPGGLIFVGSPYGGWGFNTDDPEYSKAAPPGQECPSRAPRTPAELNPAPTDDKLRQSSFFKEGPYALHGDHGSEIAVLDRPNILAEMIPALTLPIGANPCSRFSDPLLGDRNRNMNELYRWPSMRPWRHGDFRDIAYVYVWDLYDTFVLEGRLEEP
jgi:hypothetical protein